MFLGTPKDPGILPRVLDATFHYIGGHQYEQMDLKPYLRNDAQYLDPDQVKQERSVKAAIFASVKEVREMYIHLSSEFASFNSYSETLQMLFFFFLLRSVILSEPVVV